MCFTRTLCCALRSPSPLTISRAQFLPFPELMPFRLTRQLVNLLRPLYEKGLLEGTMIHALRALRDNSDLLMCVMDVFIKEPSLDWKVTLSVLPLQASSSVSEQMRRTGLPNFQRVL